MYNLQLSGFENTHHTHTHNEHAFKKCRGKRRGPSIQSTYKAGSSNAHKLDSCQLYSTDVWDGVLSQKTSEFCQMNGD